MRLRHVVSLALAGAVLLGGSSAGGGMKEPRRATVDHERRPMSQARVVSARPVETKFRPVAVPVTRISAIVKSSRELGDDASALVGETVALQMLAGDDGLQLEPEQWSAFAAVTLETQAVRQAFEATIATAVPRETGGCRVEIPIYAAAGDALRARFEGRLREKLGEACAAEILRKLGRRLDAYFGGFGVSVQTLDFALDPHERTGDWTITRTVRYWNSVEGGDTLSTRRETLFPGREDPTGVNWAPLLSVVEATLGRNVGS
jgi:hypothetical protein